MLRSILVVALLAGSAFAQPKPPRQPKPPAAPPTYTIGEMVLGAKERRLMFITFLERATEELERASLNRRSFIPELIKTIDAEQL